MADPAGSIAAPGLADCLATGAAGWSSPFNWATEACKLCWNSGEGRGSASSPCVIGTVPSKRRTVAARTNTARVHVLKRHSQLRIPNSLSRRPRAQTERSNGRSISHSSPPAGERMSVRHGLSKNLACDQIGTWTGGRSTRWNACGNSRRELSLLRYQSRRLRSDCQVVCETAHLRVTGGSCGADRSQTGDGTVRFLSESARQCPPWSLLRRSPMLSPDG